VAGDGSDEDYTRAFDAHPVDLPIEMKTTVSLDDFAAPVPIGRLVITLARQRAARGVGIGA